MLGKMQINLMTSMVSTVSIILYSIKENVTNRIILDIRPLSTALQNPLMYQRAYGITHGSVGLATKHSNVQLLP